MPNSDNRVLQGCGYRRSDCSGKIRAVAQQFRASCGVGICWIKGQGEWTRQSMASHQIETALLVLSLIVVAMVVSALYVFVVVCWMSLDLQEQVAVRGTPIVTRVKFGKCCRK